MSADTIVFLCPACSYKARIPNKYAGGTIRCPGCQSPQVATAATGSSSGVSRVAPMVKVASTPVPFTLPTDQADVLAALPVAAPVAPSPGEPKSQGDSSASKPAAGTAIVEFVCSSCHTRMRIPASYAGKSILCPKCSAPQKVSDSKTQAEPMDTTRSIKGFEPTPIPVTARPVSPRQPLPRSSRVPSGEIVPHTAMVNAPSPLEAPETVTLGSDQEPLPGRAASPRPSGLAARDSGQHAAPEPVTIETPGRARRSPEEESSVIPSDGVVAEPPAPPVRSGGARRAPPPAARSAQQQQGPRIPVLPLAAAGALLLALGGACGWLWLQLDASRLRTETLEQANAALQTKATEDLAALGARLAALEQELKAAKAAPADLPVVQSVPTAEPVLPATAEPAAAEPATPAP